MKKKIVIWCGDAPNQMALAAKIAGKYTVAGIVIEKKKPAASRKNLVQVFTKIGDRFRFYTIYDAWKKLQHFYKTAFPDWPSVPILRVESINSKETEEFSRNLSPDLVVISGTSLIKEPLLQMRAGIGLINLHTGLSPYIKGGPNCTNWCIAHNDWHLVGNTIMWINAGIDSGNIITTATVDIRQAQTLFEAHKMVMEHAHELYLNSINYLFNSQPPYISVEQSGFPKGKTFYTKMWTSEKKSALLRNWRNRAKAPGLMPPETVSLPGYFRKQS
ncbi:MAG: hypothetical protein IPI68_14840 [Chitinophagaceae bacterium]|nr:hypothetical protein [Chitinophagaceae bacterium]